MWFPARWWGPDGFTNTITTFDLRPGGAWRFVMHGPDGTNYENAAELSADMLAVAEGAAVGPSGWAELIALPIAHPPGVLPDAVALRNRLIASGGLAAEEEFRVLPGRRSPDAVAGSSRVAMQRVLLDLMAGREPRDLPPADTDEL